MMCGGVGVGKTAMAVRFTRGYFQEEHSMCPVDRFTKTIQVSCGIVLWATAIVLELLSSSSFSHRPV